ncbi:MAG TPA: type IV toxin-antitoxin system AbiEi family antitoxin domain-containing protein [Solirubrobacteraceae bacterium]|nr:type IV toxin-antitoxin system AbiEi family antitoxin domain-containing protein [Solirubrobacteraceae bacterium]
MAELAERQWGNVTTRQLRRCGLSSAAIARWAARGTLRPVHRGVYAVGHRSPAPEAWWAAALLACGRTATVGHASAAALRGLPLDDGSVVHVIVGDRARARADIVVHAASLERGEASKVRGLRATSLPRTLLDLAAAGHRVDRLLDDAVARRLVSLPTLRAYVERKEGAAGVAALRPRVTTSLR